MKQIRVLSIEDHLFVDIADVMDRKDTDHNLKIMVSVIQQKYQRERIDIGKMKIWLYNEFHFVTNKETFQEVLNEFFDWIFYLAELRLKVGGVRPVMDMMEYVHHTAGHLHELTSSKLPKDQVIAMIVTTIKEFKTRFLWQCSGIDLLYKEYTGHDILGNLTNVYPQKEAVLIGTVLSDYLSLLDKDLEDAGKL